MSLGVLLVEDDRELRTTLRDALKVEGYRVFSSASLADARAVISNALAQGGLDIMLLDLGRNLPFTLSFFQLELHVDLRDSTSF